MIKTCMVMNGHRGIQYMHTLLIVGLYILKAGYSGYKGLRVYFLFLDTS